MLFNSYEFIFLFLPVVVTSYFLICQKSKQCGNYWLIASALFFYGWWNPKYIWLILFSISMNFFLGRYYIQSRKNKFRLSVGIGFNLALLGYYKYTDFFIENINYFTGLDFSLHHIILPLGISFFSFTQIAYLVETYRGTITNPLFENYLLFVTYFPHLLAGPIIRYERMMPQFLDISLKKVNYENLSRGLLLFSIGLCKKVLIADTLGKWADAGYAHIGQTDISMVAAWSISLAYTFQLYFDFSGYSDMAIGISRMLNLELPTNFDSPYKSGSIIEFWRRWHITLSFFLRDYLYIPLGGNRKGKLRQYMNIVITMLLGGLWHGAGWTYVLWGGTHGLGIVCNHAFRQLGFCMKKWLSIPITFLFVNFAWVLFRADNVTQAMTLYKGMFVWQGLQAAITKVPTMMPDGRKEIVIEAVLFLVVVFLPNSMDIMNAMKPCKKWAALGGLLILVAICYLSHNTTFLYYQF